MFPDPIMKSLRQKIIMVLTLEQNLSWTFGWSKGLKKAWTMVEGDQGLGFGVHTFCIQERIQFLNLSSKGMSVKIMPSGTLSMYESI